MILKIVKVRDYGLLGICSGGIRAQFKDATYEDGHIKLKTSLRGIVLRSTTDP